jgi:NAD(P)-dependent dehydrogenase (short-subunit alcohol dehydrogenase family)
MMWLLEFLYSQLVFTPVYPTTSCAGQTVIVTGSNYGLGKEAARHFARLGASKLILAVRNIEAGEAAKYDIQNTTRCNPASIEVWHLDLCSYESIRTFVDRVSILPRVDVLLANAGISAKRWEIVQGHERTITVNVISTFYLAMLMLPKLKSTAREFGIRTRLTVVSTEVHGWTKFPEWKEPSIFDALNDPSKGKQSAHYSKEVPSSSE